MDYARWARRLEWAVAAAVIGLHLVIFWWPEQPARPNLLLTSAHDSQLLSGIVLILAWAVLGPGRWRLRLAALPVLFLLWFLPWNSRMVRRDTSHEFLIALSVAAVLAVVAVRLCGMRVLKTAMAGLRERGPQFSLLALLVSTTLIASLVGVLEWLRPALVADHGASLFANGIDNWEFRRILTTPEPPLNPLLARHLVMASSVVAAALGGLWVELRPGAIWLRLAAVLVVVAVLGVYLTHLAGIRGDEFLPSAVNLGVSLAQIAVLAGITALPLRLMDYRLQRQPKEVAIAPSQVTERQRVIGRAAALIGLLLVVAGSSIATRIMARRYGARVDPPTKAFAEWMEPWRKRRPILTFFGGTRIHSIRLRSLEMIEKLQADMQTIEPAKTDSDGTYAIELIAEMPPVAPDEAEPRDSALPGRSQRPSERGQPGTE